MIANFASKDKQALFSGEIPGRFRAIAAIALRKLDMLDAAVSINDLRVPRGNRLEKLHRSASGSERRAQLSGDRKGQYSIRINDQWRICFIWNDGQAEDVEIVDYHQEPQCVSKPIPEKFCRKSF